MLLYVWKSEKLFLPFRDSWLETSETSNFCGKGRILLKSLTFNLKLWPPLAIKKTRIFVMTSKLLELVTMTSPVCWRFVCNAVFFIEMGIACSCDEPARHKDAVFSRAEPCLASMKTKTRWRKARQQNEQNSHKTKRRQGDGVDIDPIGENEPAVPKIKEIKVLPPIPKRTHTTPQISYKPNRVWGGSVSSYLGMSLWARRYSGGAGIVQWWQRSPPANVARVRYHM